MRKGGRVEMALVLALTLAGTRASGQSVSGVVREQGSGAGVAGAFVLVTQLGGTARVGATTDSAGAFVMALRIRTGKYMIRVAHPSYLPYAETVQLHAQEAVQLELHLGRDAIPLQPLQVTARMQRRLEGYFDRVQRGTGFGRFLTRSQLAQIPANRTTDYLRRIPGVQLQRVEGGSMVTINNPMGECTPLIYIDGAPFEQRVGEEVDDALQPDMLEGIEVYPGPAGMPLEFAAAQSTGCGVVAFWTRDGGGRPVTWGKVLIAGLAIAAFVITSMKIML